MPDNFTTERLSLKPLTTIDAAFIFDLVNTPGWIKFIGDRKVNNIDEAVAYIEKVNSIPTIKYWVASRKEDNAPVGIVTFIKRDYLLHPDIGFAFLPAYGKNGYAHEAALALMDLVIAEYKLHCLLATTVAENINSIRLLNKLNFNFDREILVDGKNLHVYVLSAAE